MKPFSTQDFLQVEHRRRRWLLPLRLWALALAVDCLLGLAGAPGLWREVLLCGVGVAVLAVLFLRRHRLVDTAACVDRRLGSKNRLEAYAGLGSREDALAGALRRECDAYLTSHRPGLPWAWYGTLLLCLLPALADLALVPRGDSAALASAKTAQAPSQTGPAQEAPPPLPVPPASLAWVSPDFISQLFPETPLGLELKAESRHGLVQLRTDLDFGGTGFVEQKTATRVSAGEQVVLLSPSLAAGRAGSWQLLALRVRASQELPAGVVYAGETGLSSTLRFVQQVTSDRNLVAPLFSEEASEALKPERLLGSLREFLQRQCVVASQCFEQEDALLSPALGDKLGVARRALLAEQARLRKDLAAYQQKVAEAGAPGVLRELLAQAGEAMALVQEPVARVSLGGTTLYPQAMRAASRLSEAEMSLIEWALAQRRLEAEKLAAGLEAELELPPRSETPAGRLEAAASAQQALVDILQQDDEAALESYKAEAKLARELRRLSAEKGLGEPVVEAVAKAAEESSEAAVQTNQKDLPSAREPAVRAALRLREAVDRVQARGREEAIALIVVSQRRLVKAAFRLRGASAAGLPVVAGTLRSEVLDIRHSLEAGALRQQTHGDAESARVLKEFASEIQRSKVEPGLLNLAGLAGDPAQALRTRLVAVLLELGRYAAGAHKALAGEAAVLGRSLKDLQVLRRRVEEQEAKSSSSEASDLEQEEEVLNGNAGQPASPGAGSPSDSDDSKQKQNSDQEQSGMAESDRVTLKKGGSGAGANGTSGQGLRGDHEDGGSSTKARLLAGRLQQLQTQLERAYAQSTRKQRLKVGNPADAPPAYRDSVSDYFERLANPTPQPGKAKP